MRWTPAWMAMLSWCLWGEAACQTAHAHHATTATATVACELPSAAAPAGLFVDRVGQALQAGEVAALAASLHPEVMLPEDDGVGRPRARYGLHHAMPDADVPKGADAQLQRRTARIGDPLAWIGSSSELHGTQNGTPLRLLTTEPMVLRRRGSDSRMVHNPWPSHAQPPAMVAAEEGTRAWPHVEGAVGETPVLLAADGAGQSMVAGWQSVPRPSHLLRGEPVG